MARVVLLLAALVATSSCGLIEEEGANNFQTYGGDEAVDAADIDEIVDDLNRFWNEADADIADGYDYQPIPDRRITIGGEGVQCDGQEILPEDVADNAFVADCSEGVLVAYDPSYVAASLARAEATLSHEWGHVLQIQAGAAVDISRDAGGLPVDAELQADCFAGAWSSERGNADFDALIADVESTGDPAGVALHDPEAHGTADERRAAYELGLDEGPSACVDTLASLLTDGSNNN